MDMQPLLTIHTAAGKFKSATVPHPPLSMSPTSTYPLRAAMLAILAPTAWLVYVVFCLIGTTVSFFTSFLTLAFIAIMVLYVFWVAMKRPTYDEYVVMLKEKYDEYIVYVRPLASWRRRAASVREDTNAEKTQEEGKAFPV
jgi:hypothetical protein